MKPSVSLLLLLGSSFCLAETPAPATAPAAKIEAKEAAKPNAPEEALTSLGVDSVVTLDALNKIEWVQGSAPKAWEPGKVYLFECWATWCGPCVAAIPHVNELHKKYGPKGLVVSGINVWEDGKDKVEKFVKAKGDGMSYAIAYTGKGGAFETEWLKPAGVRGIPHAFLVKDGKIVLMTHPAGLTDEVIEGLLAGGDAQAKVLDGLKQREESQKKMMTKMSAYSRARSAKDADTMAKILEEVRAEDPSFRMLPMMEIDLNVARKDWPAVETSLGKLGNENKLAILFNTANTLSSEENVPPSLLKTIGNGLAKDLESKGGAMELQLISSILWRAGEKESALKYAKMSAQKAEASPSQIPASVFTSYAESMEKGTPLSTEEFRKLMRDEVMKARSAKANEAPKE